ncbi:leukotriene-B4 omega-hydroxylase 3-like [Ptychodera flava]|uniref:leukotriene-B4 omega-hydroxylase 3-like n=1 Tax=Ptychodera flava TaxID=63121 RepID=UPI003969CA95
MGEFGDSRQPHKSVFPPYVRIAFVTVCVLLAVKLCLGFVRLLQKRWRTERDLAEFPSPRRHWFFGHILAYGSNDENSFQILEGEFNAPYSPARVSWTGPFIENVMLFHPSAVQALLKTTEPKDELFYGFLRPWLGDGLLLSKAKKWQRNRRLLTPGFHFDILKPYVKIFNDCALTLVEKWSNLCKSSESCTATLEMFEHISLMTLDSLMKCVFSQDSRCQTQAKHPYIRAVYEIADLIMRRGRFPLYHNDFIYYLSPSGYRMRKALNVVHGHAWKVMRERKEALSREERQGKNSERKYVDFLDILLTARDDDGNGLTDQEIRDEVDTFMFEGHDTTASGISWCLYNLAKNPEHQRKCRDEVNELLTNKDNKEIEWEDLARLNYLTYCIKESLRLHPPVPYIGRKLTSPLNLPDGRTIPAGYRASVNIGSLHRNQLIWDRPSVFDPERFTPENSKDRSPYAYVPFAAGPRNCIGQNFAMNEIKVTLANLLHSFEFNVDECPPPNRTMLLVLKSRTGIRLRVRPCK